MIERTKCFLRDKGLIAVLMFACLVLLRKIFEEQRFNVEYYAEEKITVGRVADSCLHILPQYFLQVIVIFFTVFMICYVFNREGTKYFRVVITTIGLVILIIPNQILSYAIYFVCKVHISMMPLIAIKTITCGLIVLDSICVRMKMDMKGCLLCSSMTTFIILSTHIGIINYHSIYTHLGPDKVLHYGDLGKAIYFWVTVMMVGIVVSFMSKKDIVLGIPREKDRKRKKYQIGTLVVMAVGMLVLLAIIKRVRYEQLEEYLSWSRDLMDGERSLSTEKAKSWLVGEERMSSCREIIYLFFAGKDARFFLYYMPIGTSINLLLIYIVSRLSKKRIKDVACIYVLVLCVEWYLNIIDPEWKKMSLLPMLSVSPMLAFYLNRVLNDELTIRKAFTKGRVFISIVLIKYINAISWRNLYTMLGDKSMAIGQVDEGFLKCMENSRWVTFQAFLGPAALLVIEIIIILTLFILLLYKDEEIDDFLLPLGAM